MDGSAGSGSKQGARPRKGGVRRARSASEATHVRPVDRFIPARNAETVKRSADRVSGHRKQAKNSNDHRSIILLELGLTQDSVKGIVAQTSELRP